MNKTITIAEFAELTSSIVSNGVENSSSLIALIESQTPAKQKKFWAYYDKRVIDCKTCGTKMYKSHAKASNGVHYFCSTDCCQANLNKFNYVGAGA